MRAPAISPAKPLGRLALTFVALMLATLAMTIPAKADEPSVAKADGEAAVVTEFADSVPNAEGDGAAAVADATSPEATDATTLASYLSGGMLRVSADVALVDGGDEAIEPVVGSFTVDGLTYAIVGEGEVALVAVSPRTLAGGLAGGFAGSSSGAPSGEDSGSGVPPRSVAEQVPLGATSPSPSPEGASSDALELQRPDAILGSGADGAEGLVAPGSDAGSDAEDAGEPATLTLPEFVSYDGIDYSLAAIGPRALVGCDAATLALPASVATVDQAAFEGSPVASIEVADGNPDLASYDGMLFDADRTRLLLVPEGKQGAARIPKEAEVVDPSCFSHSAGVSSIDVEAGSAAFSSRNGCLYDASGETLICSPPSATASSGLLGPIEPLLNVAEGISQRQLSREFGHVYAIYLSPGSGSGGASVIYQKMGYGWYADRAATQPITHVPKPTAPSHQTFAGYIWSAGEGVSGTAWRIDKDGKINDWTEGFTADVVFVAQYDWTVYEIALAAGEGSGGPAKVYQKYSVGWFHDAACTQKITAASPVAKPTPRDKYKEFKGYLFSNGVAYIKADGTPVGSTTGFVANATLTASYDWKVFEIALAAGEGSGGPAKVYQKYSVGWFSGLECRDDQKITKVTTPTRSFHDFMGYYWIDVVTGAHKEATPRIAADGTITSSSTAFIADVTFQADWRKHEALFVANGEGDAGGGLYLHAYVGGVSSPVASLQGGASHSVVWEGATQVLGAGSGAVGGDFAVHYYQGSGSPLHWFKAARPGYDQRSWEGESADGKERVTITGNDSRQPIRPGWTYAPTWEAHRYRVAFDPAGGAWDDAAAGKAVSAAFDQDVTLAAAPKRSGYLFAGWEATGPDGAAYSFDAGATLAGGKLKAAEGDVAAVPISYGERAVEGQEPATTATFTAKWVADLRVDVPISVDLDLTVDWEQGRVVASGPDGSGHATGEFRSWSSGEVQVAAFGQEAGTAMGHRQSALGLFASGDEAKAGNLMKVSLVLSADADGAQRLSFPLSGLYELPADRPPHGAMASPQDLAPLGLVVPPASSVSSPGTLRVRYGIDCAADLPLSDVAIDERPRPILKLVYKVGLANP